MKLTGAAILVSRGMKVLRAAPAAYPYRSLIWNMPMTLNEVIPAFLEICPGLHCSWKEHLQFWAQSDERGIYNDMNVVGEYMVHQYEAGAVGEFPGLFQTIERCLAEGDDECQKVITIGIVECIWGLSRQSAFGSAAFEQWLLPRTRLAWIMGEASWDCEFDLVSVLETQLRSGDTELEMPDLSAVRSPEFRAKIERLYPKRIPALQA